MATYFGRDSKTRFKFSYELVLLIDFRRVFPVMNTDFRVRRWKAPSAGIWTGRDVLQQSVLEKHHGERVLERKRGAIDGVINRHLTEFFTLDEHYLRFTAVSW